MELMVALPVYREVSPPTQKSLLNTLSACVHASIRLTLQQHSNNPYVALARNILAHQFLKSKCDVLFFLDADIEYEPEDLICLAKLATELDVVGAAYPSRKEPLEFAHSGESGDAEWRHGCFSMQGLGYGLGFTALSRSAMQSIADVSPLMPLDDEGGSDELCREIFRTGLRKTARSERLGADGSWTGEDIGFFLDLAKLGYKTWINPNVTLGHWGTKIYRGKLADAMTVEEGEGNGRTASGCGAPQGETYRDPPRGRVDATDNARHQPGVQA